MKLFLLKLRYLILSLFFTYTASAQLTITPGGQFSVFSDTKLTLQNTDLINNGNLLLATTSPVSFTGDASSFIGGDEVVRFFKIEINKTGNQSVTLQKTINVGSGVFFTSGFFNLNGFNVDLETTGSINGENNDSRFVGSNGGQILLTTTLNAPVNANPGNLGIAITSNQNLGQVIIKRGHQVQVGQGLVSSVLRYFELSPANNTNLNAAIRFNYFDAELNGFNENSLSVFKSDNAINWTDMGFTSRDAIGNFVEKTGINSVSRFTLSTANNPLPVQFISFSANCENDKVKLSWKTAQEQNSNYFAVERSTDQIHWTVIGNLPAAGNSSTEKNYSYVDNNSVQNAFYRIAEYNLDGSVQYSGILRSSCDAIDVFKVWPNPVHEKLFIDLIADRQSDVLIKLFDSKGALIKMQRSKVSKGNNQLVVDMSSLANGIYHLATEWNNGQSSKSERIVKQ